MNKREVVYKELDFDNPAYVPWLVRLNVEVQEKLESATGKENMENFLNSHFI